MSRIDNLGSGDLADILRRLRRLETATPMNNAAVGRSGMEFYDGGTLTISNGGLVVNGSAQIVGTLNADGTINMSGLFIASGEMRLNGTTIATGDFNIDGPLIVDGNTTFNGTLNINGVTTIAGDTTVTGKFVTNGAVDINGLTKIVGTLNVEGLMNIKGETTLTGDLNVIGAGNIQVGDNMLLLPGVAGGSIRFNTGASVEGTPNGAQLKGPSGTTFVYVSPGQAGITSGLNAFLVTAAGAFINNLPTTTAAPNMHVSEGGLVSRSTA